MRLFFASLFTLFLVTPSWAQDAPKAKRPNILWITCEDMGPHIGPYGDKYATTPSLDAFGKRALRYKRAWSNAPVCAPARTTIITGLYPPSTGSEHMRSMVPIPERIQLLPSLMRRLGYYCTNHVKEDYNVRSGKVWNESSKSAHYKNRAAGQPFFAVINFTITHESQIRTRPHKFVHDPAKAPIPPYHPDTPEVRLDWAQYYDNITAMDRMVGQVLAELEAEGLAEDTIVFFYADHGSGMPRNKRTPLDCGLRVPMLLHIPAQFRHLAPKDYAPGGESERLVSFVDLAPTVLSLAGSPAPETMHGKAFLGPHAAEPREHLFGYRARMDERHDLVRSVTDGKFTYVRNFFPHRLAGQHVAYMFETPTTVVWKKLFDAKKLPPQQAFFFEPRLPEELYDLTSDPHEIKNLATSPAHAADLERLRAVLAKKHRDTRDVSFLPEDEMLRRSAGKSPYELGQDPKAYDVDRIVSMAEFASDVRVTETRKLSAAFDDPEPAIRYWAAIGALGRGKAGVDAHRVQLEKALSDPAPSVRIVAAEALGVHGDAGDVGKALNALVPLASLKANGVAVSVQALNALDALGPKAKSRLADIVSAGEGNPQVEPRVNSLVPRLVESIRRNCGEVPQKLKGKGKAKAE